MLKIWRYRQFWRFFFYFILIGTVGGGLVVFILEESGALDINGDDEKYVYYFKNTESESSPIYVA